MCQESYDLIYILEMLVRDFKASDAPDIIRLHRTCAHWFEELDVGEAFVHEAADRPDFRFLVAEDEGHTMGFIGTLFYEHVGRAEVGPICVEPRCHGGGVGAMLLEKVLGFLSQRGIHRVVAKVKANNENAQRFFSSNGFAEEARLRGYTKDREDAIQYVRFLM